MNRFSDLSSILLFDGILNLSSFSTLVIFDVLIISTIFAILVFIPSSVTANTSQTFQKSLEYANSLRGNVKKAILEFKPKEKFKNLKGGYTDNPSQVSYYESIGQGNAYVMEKAAIESISKNESEADDDKNSLPAAGKFLTKNFQTRPVFKITQNDEYVKRGNLITKNAKDIVAGESNKDVSCTRNNKNNTDNKNDNASKANKENRENKENENISLCVSTFIKKTCNEEIRTVRRICEKAPEVNVVVKDYIYPNCQRMVITTGWRTYCPSGYSEILYSDMVGGPVWDDIRFCTRGVSVNDRLECYSGGYYIASNNGYFGSGQATVPKKMKARIRLSKVYHGNVKGTIINETTGQVIRNRCDFRDGDVVELPYSDTLDQKFKFYAIPPENRGWSWQHTPGVMVLYVDHINKSREAEIIWNEECRDV